MKRGWRLQLNAINTPKDEGCDGGRQEVSFHFPCRDLGLCRITTCRYIRYMPLKFDAEVVKTLEKIEKAPSVCIDVHIHDVKAQAVFFFFFYSMTREGLSVISK